MLIVIVMVFPSLTWRREVARLFTPVNDFGRFVFGIEVYSTCHYMNVIWWFRQQKNI